MVRAAKAGNNVLLALKVSRTEIVLEVMIVRNRGRAHFKIQHRVSHRRVAGRKTEGRESVQQVSPGCAGHCEEHPIRG